MRLAESKLTAAEVEDDLQLRDAQLARACALAPAGNRGWSAEWIMLREILRKPREMGTICPSSARLGRLMASFVNREEEGTIVELGAGTGAVTAALIQRGVSPGRLIVIEKSELLAEHLSERFPKICVRHADAAEQPKPFNQAGTINTIVSCLPLRSLPAAQVAQIAETWAPLLAPGGRVIQFTYAPFNCTAWLATGLVRISSNTVWLNLPPARVEVFAAPILPK